MSCQNKIVVFDLDETLGYFMELGMFWDAIKSYIKSNKINLKIDQQLFNEIVDLYPEFLRPNIINILKFLKKKKQQSSCSKIMIYTNNQGPNEWSKYIINYFETKINYKLFDQIIGAFKINGKPVELCRTTHMKTHTDLIKCTQIPDDTQICFLDDVFYPGMSNNNIYYINIKPYIYDLTFDMMIKRFINSGILNANKVDTEKCKEYILEYTKRYNYTFIDKHLNEQNIDTIVSKKILDHLRIFFNIKPNNETKKQNQYNTTKTKRSNIKNKTLKSNRKH
jgi:hypothetical protein